MKLFESFVSNGEYAIGCTGGTVYVYGSDKNEIARFRDIRTYVYKAAISPNGKVFAVKSNDGLLAIYSFETMSLIKNFRCSIGDDDNFCFTKDGNKIINLECHIDSLHSRISIYNVNDGSLAKRTVLNNEMLADFIEYDKTYDCYFVLGIIRQEDNENLYFVAKFDGDAIVNITKISEMEYNFYHRYKYEEFAGYPLDDRHHTLGKLFEYYSTK